MGIYRDKGMPGFGVFGFWYLMEGLGPSLGFRMRD